ncbi:unnamed protein product [Callosobruchus maculatus]|uniref:TFIIS N-terminal domain-containing protein n=1 Tax=Callosobruchus maculatus TaxID=64391 RepID=A0A653CLJ0_CALMS|nr:unnamed protein product [Callosobruchus maculatus]
MPRIDPLQLLKCLSVLLSPEGGILSRDEVPRLVNLMMKFSKKLVSKCVYVLILKNTQKDLVDMFMSEGGWHLIQTWLQDAVQINNWDLVKEILGLLLVTPVDVERLKLNILPKLIKSLSRREELDGVSQLSTELVQQWLSVVKGNAAAQLASSQANTAEPNEHATTEAASEVAEQGVDAKEVTAESDTISTNTFYNSASKNNELVLSRLRGEGEKDDDEKPETTDTVPNEKAKEDTEKEKEKEKEKDERKEEKQKSSSKSKSSSSSSSSSKDKDRDRHRDKDKKKSSSKSSSSSRDKDRSKSSSSSSSKDKDRKDRDRHRHNGEVKSSSSRSSSSKDKDKKDSSKSKDVKESKEKQAEKDKDTLAKLKPPTIERLGKIPKKASVTDEKNEKEKEELNQIKKKFSVGVKKNSEERPKTVKVFNSKMRSTGLEEEVKPAPPRPVKKPTPSVQLPTIPMKRPSPPRESHKDPPIPPEKKLKFDKVDLPERPGAIKLIPPKPKRKCFRSLSYSRAIFVFSGGIQTDNAALLSYRRRIAELRRLVLLMRLLLDGVWYHPPREYGHAGRMVPLLLIIKAPYPSWY